VNAQDDANVFGKVGTSGAEFQKAMSGKKVLDANQQGKYFWFAPLISSTFNYPRTNASDRLIMSSPPHPFFHFGMTGV
jgi:formamidopyrimidine-DNA glycosylase